MGFFRTFLLALLAYLLIKVLRRPRDDSSFQNKTAPRVQTLEASACPHCGAFTTGVCESEECRNKS